VAAVYLLEHIGLPEARLNMAQAIIAVCESPKSNSVCTALEAAVADAGDTGDSGVPVHLRDTHYRGAERLGHGEGYLYPHDFPGHYVQQQYAPPGAEGMPYYVPSQQGFEAEVRSLRAARGRVDPPKD